MLCGMASVACQKRSQLAPRQASSAAGLTFGIACMLALASSAAQGQHFGRNKVLYDEFDFAILETEHFRVHYYPESSPNAEYVARSAERWYARLSGLFEHDFEDKKPLVIYQDHADFQQTTTTPGMIGEATGGFTESLQDRIVLPLTGINADNDHVIGHELVHAFQFDMAKQSARPEPDQQRGGGRQQVRRLPLWVVEGLAEYLSEGRRDPHTALYLRDAVLHDALPEPGRMIQRQPSPYQYGQAVWAYVGGKWGDDTVARLYKRAAGVGPRQAFDDVLNLELTEFFDEFHAALRSAYEPLIDGRQNPASIAEPLLTADTTRARVNIAPSLSPDGRRVAFLSTREFAMDLFLADARTGRIEKRLASADADPHYDNLSFLDSSVAWSPDGSRLAFAVFAKGERRLAIYDVERGRIVRRLDVPGIKGMRHASWAPDGETVVFSAVVDGASDLYRLDLATGAIERLTNDPYTAIQPVFAPDGSRVVFVTDRGPDTDIGLLDFGDLRLATLDLTTQDIELLPLFDQGKHVDPHFTADGRSLYFVGEPDGAPDLFRYDFEDGGIFRLMSLKTGVSGITRTSPAISVAVETGAVAVTVLEDGGWNVYRYMPDEGMPVGREGMSSAAAQLPPEPASDARRIVDTYLDRPELGLPEASRVFATRDYESRIGLAAIGPATIGIGRSDAGSAAGGSFGAYLADTLNRHQVLTTVRGASAGGVLDFSDTLGGEVTYLNQTNRFQWGASLSRLPYLTSAIGISRGPVELDDGSVVPADIFDRLYRIVTDTRLSLLGRYPLSVNNRFEFGIGLNRIDFDVKLERTVFPDGAPAFRDEIDLPAPEALDLQNTSAAFVRDTSRFGFVSPVRGTRFRAEYQYTTGDLDYGTTLIDFRKYWLKRPVTFALRALHIGRRGEDANDSRLAPLDIARGGLVRGYSFDDFDVSECTRAAGATECPELERLIGTRIGVMNLELRLPLIGNDEYGLFEFPAAPTELFFFVDAGAAWTGAESVEASFRRNTSERVPVVSSGIGVRSILVGSLPIEFYYAYPHQRPNADPEFGFRIRTGW